MGPCRQKFSGGTGGGIEGVYLPAQALELGERQL
jgi:hypothetical protein